MSNNRLGSVIVRAVIVWLLIILCESVNGTIRELYITPAIGSSTAHSASFAIALVLIGTIALIFIKWIRATGTHQLLVVGLVWVALTFCFELGLGVFVLGMPWDRFRSDYDITNGGLMAYGLVYALFVPLIAAKLRRV